MKDNINEEHDDVDAIYQAAFETGYDQGYSVGYSEALEDKELTDLNQFYNHAIDDIERVLQSYDFDLKDEVLASLHLLRKI